MAISALTVYEVRPNTGADTNSGGFVTGASGTDYSQQASPQYALTGLTTAAANAIILSASAAADMVGNIIRITAGTNFITGLYQITAVSVGVSITVDRTCTSAAGAAGTANIGGAIKTLGQLHTILTTSNNNATGQTAWVKAEITITTAVQISLSPNGGNGSQSTQINGYTTTRGDNGQVTIQRSSGTGFTLLFMQVSGQVIIRNFILDGNSGGTLQGGQFLGAYVQIENFKAMNCPSGGILFNNTNNKAIRCVATANGSYGFSTEQGNGPNVFIDCVAYANTGTGFLGAVGMYIGCISGNNTGAGSDGFGSSAGLGQNSQYLIIEACAAYTNGRDGFKFSNTIQCTVVFENCWAWGNGTSDIVCTATAVTSGGITNNHNAYATQSGYPASTSDVVLTGDPTVAGASNNFALNSTVGAGAALRAAGFPGAYAVGGTGYQDIGPIQHQDAAPITNVIYVLAPNVTNYLIEEGDEW